jgi:lipoprotein-anchoring transpeptidase ErfK/SrfK
VKNLQQLSHRAPGPTERYRAFVRALLVILAAAAVAGCGGADNTATSSDVTVAEKEVTVAKETVAQETVAKKPISRKPTPCVAGSTRPVGTPRTTYAAVVRERAQAFRRPGSGRLASFGPKNVNGVSTIFAVLAKRVDEHCAAQWYRVQLPVKPNESTGWVRAADVELAPVTTRIEVDLSERRVTLFDRGRRVLTTTAAIGSPQTPTPTGNYYVNQRLVPTDASGPFGPGAIGISAFSEVLTGWTQGGPIAIHGTNRPDLIGRAVSNGCIRVRNDQLRRLFERAVGGTPVTVRS